MRCIRAVKTLRAAEGSSLRCVALYTDVDRDARVVVRARNLDWDEVTIEATGLEAFCLQHEIDHLDGVLFIDRISRLERDLYTRRRKRQLRRERESATSAVSAEE